MDVLEWVLWWARSFCLGKASWGQDLCKCKGVVQGEVQGKEARLQGNCKAVGVCEQCKGMAQVVGIMENMAKAWWKVGITSMLEWQKAYDVD